MPPPAQVNAMPVVDTSFNIREFVADEDVAHIGSALWKTIDQSAYVVAQRKALEEYNIQKAIKLSEQTAALESQRREATPSSSTVPAATGRSSASSSSAANTTSRSTTISKSANDEVAALSLARSCQVEASQPALLEKAPSPLSSASAAAAAMPVPKSHQKSSSPPSSYSPSHYDRKSATQMAKQPSQAHTSNNLSLSVSSASASSSASNSYAYSSSSFSSSSSSSGRTYNLGPGFSVASEAAAALPSSATQSRVSSRGSSRSNSTQGSNSTPILIPASSFMHTSTVSSASHNHMDQRTFSRTEPEPSSHYYSSLQMQVEPLQYPYSSASTVSPSPPSNSAHNQAHTSTSSSRSKVRERRPSIASIASVSTVTPTHSSSHNTSQRTSPSPPAPPAKNFPTSSNTYSKKSSSASPGTAAAVPLPVSASTSTSSTSSSSSVSARDVRKGQIMNPSPMPASSSGNPSGSGKDDRQQAQSSQPSPTANSRSNSEKQAQVQTLVPAPVQAVQQARIQDPAPVLEQRTENVQGRKTSSKDKDLDRSLFMANRNCVKCGHLIVSPHAESSSTDLTSEEFNQQQQQLMHVTCPGCKTTFCRGCFTVARCTSSKTSSQCTGSAGCSIISCCSQVRAIAIFEALSAFDHVYAVEAGFPSTTNSSSYVAAQSSAMTMSSSPKVRESAQMMAAAMASKAKGQQATSATTSTRVPEIELEDRKAYVGSLITKSADKSDGMKRFELAFQRAMKVVCAALVPSEEDEVAKLHPSIPHLFALSYLPEVMHFFLNTTNVRCWVAHSETYIIILDTLKIMLNCEAGVPFEQLLTEPLRHVSSSFFFGGDAKSDNINNKSNKTMDVATVAADADPIVVTSVPLCELVRQLEKHRSPLMDIAQRMTFPPTKDKVNNLCDGISYLMFQVVGI